MTSSPAPDLDELERLLNEPEKWQGVDRRGAWIASTVDGEHVYVRDVILALLQEVRQLRLQSRTMLARAARKYLAVVNERYHGRATWGDVATADADLREILDADP